MGEREACRNCRRPIHWVNGVGWLHGELPQYAYQPITCDSPHPSGCTHPITKPCPRETDGRP